MLIARRRVVQGPVVLLLGGAFAAANGMGYGGGNLRQYLLHGLHAIDPNFLSNDWFTTQTRPHHVAFNAMLAVVGRVMPLNVALGAANFALAIAFALCLYGFIERRYTKPALVLGVTLLIVLFSPRSPIALLSNLSSYFQPAGVGAVGMIGGMVLMSRRRWRAAAGVLLGAGIFHINYAVWSIGLILVVAAFNRRALRRGDWIALTVCVLGIAAFHLPFFLASRAPDQRVFAPYATRILHDVYMPYHARPRTWAMERWVRFGALLLAGVVAALAARPRRVARVEWTILGYLTASTVLGVCLTLVIETDWMAILVPYRMALMLAMLGQVAIAGAMVTLATTPTRSLGVTCAVLVVLAGLLHMSGLTGHGFGVLCACIAALLAERVATTARIPWELTGTGLVIAFIATGLWRIGAGKTCLALIATFGVLGGIRRFGPELGGWMARVGDARWLAWARPTLIAVIALFIARVGGERRDHLTEPRTPDEALLYDWSRSRSPRDAVFVVPPDLGGFRLGAERAVVVDFKCMPILPADTLEWARRMADECGGPVTGQNHATAGYQGIDPARADWLRARYQADFLVIERNRTPPALQAWRPVYANPTYAVFDLAGWTPQTGPKGWPKFLCERPRIRSQSGSPAPHARGHLESTNAGLSDWAFSGIGRRAAVPE